MRRAPNFDRLARAYRWMERLTFGRSLSRCRCALLDDIQSARNALLIGDGDGRFAARLLQENLSVHIDAVDSSLAMLQVLVQNSGLHAGRVSTYHADVLSWAPPHPPYDLVVAHFSLDCFTTDEAAALARRLRSSFTPTARWVISEFATPKGWFGGLIARPLVFSLYLSFNMLTGLGVRRLPDHRKALTTAGFVLERELCWLGGLLVSEMWIPGQESDFGNVSRGI
jgi:hypothetical protein